MINDPFLFFFSHHHGKSHEISMKSLQKKDKIPIKHKSKKQHTHTQIPITSREIHVKISKNPQQKCRFPMISPPKHATSGSKNSTAVGSPAARTSSSTRRPRARPLGTSSAPVRVGSEMRPRQPTAVRGFSR